MRNRNRLASSTFFAIVALLIPACGKDGKDGRDGADGASGGGSGGFYMFSYEQAAEEVITEVGEGSARVFRTLTISNLPVDDSGNVIQIGIPDHVVVGIGKVDAAGSLSFVLLEDDRTLLEIGHSAVGSFVRDISVNAMGTGGWRQPTSTTYVLKISAYVNSGSVTGTLKNFKVALQLAIPPGATVVES